MASKFAISSDKLFHLSVGAVIVNDEGEILAHYFDHFDHFGGIDDFYILMRETLEDDETLEQAVHRGCMEEFGAEVEITSFLGGALTNPVRNNQKPDMKPTFDKTTLYFLCRLKNYDFKKRSEDDPEFVSSPEFRRPGYLIEKMKEQRVRLNTDDADESQIIERAVVAMEGEK